MLWSSHKMSHFVWSAFDEVISLLFVGALYKLDVFGVLGSRWDATMLSIYSVDAANIGVIAHEPTLWNVSCDNIILGCRTDSI